MPKTPWVLKIHGFSTLELFVGLIFFSILFMSFFYIRRSRVNSSITRICTEQQWRWSRALDEMEHKLHRWEMLGSNCLESGFDPISIGERGEVHFFEIQSSRPIVRPMVTPGLIEIPASSMLITGKQVLLCGKGKHVGGTVTRAYQTTAGRPFPVQLDIQGEDSNQLFSPGTWVAEVVPVELITEASEQPPAKYLYEKKEGAQRLITAGFDTFVLKANRNSSGMGTVIEMGMSLR